MVYAPLLSEERSRLESREILGDADYGRCQCPSTMELWGGLGEYHRAADYDNNGHGYDSKHDDAHDI